MTAKVSVPSLRSDVEEELRKVDEVLEVERPAQVHLDRQAHHHQEQEDEHAVPRETHLLVKALQRRPGQERRKSEDVEEGQEDAGKLPHVPQRRKWSPEQPHPEDLREMDVHERQELVDVPVLVRTEEVPVGTAQERARDDQKDPQDDEPEQEEADLP